MTLKKIKANQMFNIAVDGFSVLIQHESNALDNQLSGLRERLIVAQKARSLGELLRNQFDLLPDTQARIIHDHGVRSALLKGFRRDLQSSVGIKHRA